MHFVCHLCIKAFSHAYAFNRTTYLDLNHLTPNHHNFYPFILNDK